MNGLLNVEKPEGVTSRDVVNWVVRALPRSKPRPKVGHAGTLDPLASGVLVVAIGRATRLIEYVQRMAKTYHSTILLGAVSDTLDADGTVEAVPDAPRPTEAMVLDALASQVGTIEQLPPAFSALRVEGKRAYDLARQGKAVELAPRKVRIARVALVRFEWPELEVEVDCGAGTYIRSIARDVGDGLGCGGLIRTLRRTRIGPFLVGDALRAEGPGSLSLDLIADRLRPMREAVADLPALTLGAEGAEAVRLGRSVGPVEGLPAPTSAGEAALLDPGGELLAIAEVDPGLGCYRPRRVLADGSGRIG
jgi:tRNA pseudouridine55 synthase